MAPATRPRHEGCRLDRAAGAEPAPRLIVGTITLPFRLLGVLIGSLLFSIVVECVGMHLFWKDQGWRHSQQMLQYELGHLSSHFTRSVVVQEPGARRTSWWIPDTNGCSCARGCWSA
jgi:integrating conjugative element membrane protein (TIGR03747 family)